MTVVRLTTHERKFIEALAVSPTFFELSHWNHPNAARSSRPVIQLDAATEHPQSLR